jgi:hypothetical protein
LYIIICFEYPFNSAIRKAMYICFFEKLVIYSRYNPTNSSNGRSIPAKFSSDYH